MGSKDNFFLQFVKKCDTIFVQLTNSLEKGQKEERGESYADS